MKTKQEILQEDDDKVDSGHMEIAGWFEQTIPLIGHAFNAITNQLRLNVLNTLMDNSTKVKEMLRLLTGKIHSQMKLKCLQKY